MSKVSEAEVRAEVREWLAANWDPDMSLLEWRRKLADSGWGMPQWSREWYGRGLPHAIVDEADRIIRSVRAHRIGRTCRAAMDGEHSAPRATSFPPARPWSSWRPLSRWRHAEWRSIPLRSTTVLCSFLVAVLISACVSLFRAVRCTFSCSCLSSPFLTLAFALLVIRLSICFTLVLALRFPLLFAVFPLLLGPLLSLLALFPL